MTVTMVPQIIKPTNPIRTMITPIWKDGLFAGPRLFRQVNRQKSLPQRYIGKSKFAIYELGTTPNVN